VRGKGNESVSRQNLRVIFPPVNAGPVNHSRLPVRPEVNGGALFHLKSAVADS